MTVMNESHNNISLFINIMEIIQIVIFCMINLKVISIFCLHLSARRSDEMTCYQKHQISFLFSNHISSLSRRLFTFPTLGFLWESCPSEIRPVKLHHRKQLRSNNYVVCACAVNFSILYYIV